MARDIFKKWFDEALNDFEVGLILKKSKKYNSSVFHFQQAAEKALKAILYFHDQQPWGHSSLELINSLVEIGLKSYSKFISYAKEIDRHYTTTRYPDTLPGISPKEAYDKKTAKRVQNLVSELMEYIRMEFNKEDKKEEKNND